MGFARFDHHDVEAAIAFQKRGGRGQTGRTSADNDHIGLLCLRSARSGGASRIAGELARHKPAVVVIELGANDGLRGLPLAQTRANLERMIVASKNAGARVLLLGMRMPPNFGPQYTQGFERNYSELA